MKTYATILGTAGTIAFGALSLTAAATASAAPQHTYALTGAAAVASAPFAEGHGSGSDRQSDRFRECMERARINGYTGIGLPVAAADGCSASALPGLVGLGH